MAKQDMRIDVDFVDHPKTKRLIRQTGYEGFYCLMKLFSIAAKIYKRGELKNLDASDIEDLTGWTGEQGKLVESLLDPKICFLEQDGDLFIIHDWEVYQPWIYYSEKRSEKAKKAINARWNKEKEDTLNNSGNTQKETDDTTSIRNVYETYEGSNSPSPLPLPLPLPTPIPQPSLKNPPNPPAGGNGVEKKQKQGKQFVTEIEAYKLIESRTSGQYASMLKTFLKHRQQIKKPMTLLALEQTLDLLDKKLDSDQERIDCIQLSIANGWTGLIPERVKQARQPANKPSQFTLANEDRWKEYQEAHA
ncbi:MAG: hypothetical protein EOM15_08840 [Spirochaetia bacterium]|nr:hypothetical protein [Spirochaetia bacterium]